jgi:hypothetical protein
VFKDPETQSPGTLRLSGPDAKRDKLRSASHVGFAGSNNFFSDQNMEVTRASVYFLKGRRGQGVSGSRCAIGLNKAFDRAG